MTNSQRINKLQSLSRGERHDLSESECCKRKQMGNHERLMWAAGFRKGLSQSLRGSRALVRAEVRALRGRPGDKAWAGGFSKGVNYAPVDTLAGVKKKNERKTKLSKTDLRRLKRTGAV